MADEPKGFVITTSSLRIGLLVLVLLIALPAVYFLGHQHGGSAGEPDLCACGKSCACGHELKIPLPNFKPRRGEATALPYPPLPHTTEQSQQ